MAMLGGRPHAQADLSIVPALQVRTKLRSFIERNHHGQIRRDGLGRRAREQ